MRISDWSSDVCSSDLERGMGSAVGQVPEYIEMVTRWCKAHTRMPVFVKLTPNVTSILGPARAAKKGGADAVSLINTVNSIMSVDLDALEIGRASWRERVCQEV